MTNLEKIVLTMIVLLVPYILLIRSVFNSMNDVQFEIFKERHRFFLAFTGLTILSAIAMIIVGGGFSLIIRIWE